MSDQPFLPELSELESLRLAIGLKVEAKEEQTSVRKTTRK